MSEFISTDREAPVLVIGAAGLDIVGRLRAELKMFTSNPAQIRMSFGGVARNIAENLARLGQPTRLLTAVGTDPTGDRIIERLDEAGVDASRALRLANRSTGSYIGAINEKGELQFALDDMRTVASITPAYLKENSDWFRGASMLFVDANLPRESLRTAFSLARQAHLPICADPISTGLAVRLQPYLDRLLLITPNSAEAGVLCERTVEPAHINQGLDAAKCLVSKGVKIAIVTLAQFGVVYATKETSGQVSAIRTEIVDPTGGGDALTAAVMFALLNDIPLDDAVRLGVSAASLTLRHLGAVIPDLSLQKLYDALII